MSILVANSSMVTAAVSSAPKAAQRRAPLTLGFTSRKIPMTAVSATRMRPARCRPPRLSAAESPVTVVPPTDAKGRNTLTSATI